MRERKQIDMGNLDFGRGVSAAQEAAKRSGSGGRIGFFSLDDKESAILRFITDADPDENGVGGWITVLQHNSVPTKAKPKAFPGQNWPAFMSAVCRNGKPFNFGDCYICATLPEPENDSKGKKKQPRGVAKPRTWALACLREAVKEGGRIIGYRDKRKEVTKKVDGEDKTTEERELVLVNLGYNNFFEHLEGPAAVYDTLLDRDYHITRKGTGLDTEYQPVALDPITMEGGARYDLRDPEVLKRYGFDSLAEADELLQEEISNRASEDFYARFFDPNVEADWGSSGGDDDDDAEGDDSKPAEVSNERLKEMQARISGRYKPADGDEAAEEKPKAESAPRAL